RAAIAYVTSTEPSESSNADTTPLPSDPRPASRAHTEPGRRVTPSPARPPHPARSTDTKLTGPSRAGGCDPAPNPLLPVLPCLVLGKNNRPAARAARGGWGGVASDPFPRVTGGRGAPGWSPA